MKKCQISVYYKKTKKGIITVRFMYGSDEGEETLRFNFATCNLNNKEMLTKEEANEIISKNKLECIDVIEFYYL